LADPIERIVVSLQVGSDRMAGTDDPMFLGLRGPAGREFRLALAHGKVFRRKGEEHYVFGSPKDDQTNVDHASLNDPTEPALDLEQVVGVYICKRQEPIPNVRGVGEMEDRVQLQAVEVELVAGDATQRYRREGPIWLGLTCGLSFDLVPEGRG